MAHHQSIRRVSPLFPLFSLYSVLRTQEATKEFPLQRNPNPCLGQYKSCASPRLLQKCCMALYGTSATLLVGGQASAQTCTTSPRDCRNGRWVSFTGLNWIGLYPESPIQALVSNIICLAGAKNHIFSQQQSLLNCFSSLCLLLSWVLSSKRR